MDRNFVEKWLYDLKNYQFKKDILGATSLFKKTEFYQETPFLIPFRTFEEIEKEWQHIQKEDIKKIDFQILAIDGCKVIVEWYLEQNDDIFDGVYEIKFNNNLNCIYFKSWEMQKKKK